MFRTSGARVTAISTSKVVGTQRIQRQIMRRTEIVEDFLVTIAHGVLTNLR